MAPPPPTDKSGSHGESCAVIPDVQGSQARLAQQFYLLPVDEGRIYDGFGSVLKCTHR